jgi:hypothetical protein
MFSNVCPIFLTPVGNSNVSVDSETVTVVGCEGGVFRHACGGFLLRNAANTRCDVS